MIHSERAVVATAVLELNFAALVTVLCVAWITEVICSEAVEQGYRAAVLALPVNVSSAMLLTVA